MSNGELVENVKILRQLCNGEQNGSTLVRWETLDLIIDALSTQPVSTQTDNAELVEKIKKLERSAKNRVDTGFPISPEGAYMIAIQDFREAISALTQVSPSEGVVISRECAKYLYECVGTPADVIPGPELVNHMNELHKALQEHDNG